MSYDWIGTYLQTDFTGGSIAVDISEVDTSYHNVFIDGQFMKKIKVYVRQTHTEVLEENLSKGKHRLILQKCTELGVSNFVPIISERSIRKDFNIDRARKIVVEASEQCGRSSIPHVREPVHLEKILEEYKGKISIFVAHQGGDKLSKIPDKAGVLIGPEGGWSPNEIEIFEKYKYPHISISEFVLRAETAAITASSLLTISR